MSEIKCSNCDCVFINKASLWSHIAKEHPELCSDVKSKLCKLCNKSKNINDFYVGQNRCIECLKAKETCVKCDKEYSVKYINEHTKRCGGKEKDTRKCNHCKINKSLNAFSVGKYTCKECLKSIKVCSRCKGEYRFRNQKEHDKRCIIKI